MVLKQLLVFTVICALGVAGCTTLRSLPNLQPGVASEADATTMAGKPAHVWQNPDGTRTVEYSQQPSYGDIAYMVNVDASGKVLKVEKINVEENAKRINVGMTHEQVRRLLGTPRTIVNYGFSGEEVWDWNLPFNPNDEPRVRLNVHFKGGKVIRTSRTEDEDCNRYSMMSC